MRRVLENGSMLCPRDEVALLGIYSVERAGASCQAQYRGERCDVRSLGVTDKRLRSGCSTNPARLLLEEFVEPRFAVPIQAVDVVSRGSCVDR